jgi:RNA polymerase sigma-70 factor, ECF subfamily
MLLRAERREPAAPGPALALSPGREPNLMSLQVTWEAGYRSFIIARHADMGTETSEITALLARISGGDRAAEDLLLPQVYVELHRIARRQLGDERAGHTLQATALVHEAYLRLCKNQNIEWKDRMHFYRVAAKLMRRILIDYARQRNATKRGSGAHKESFDEALLISDDRLGLVLEIDDLLNRLAQWAPRLAQVVEMRFFGGLSEQEIAAALNESVRTVKRDWAKARAWLHDQIKPS